jgi:hypothetical protein
MKKTLVVNLFAGPGTGKSTTMAHVFAELKWRGIDCEMAPEYAKDKVWEESIKTLDSQFYISGKQYHRLRRLKGKVDIIVTDSPLLLGMYYGRNEPKEYIQLIAAKHIEFNNLNIFLERKKKFNPNGRLQNENQAKDIDIFLREEILPRYCPNAIHIPAEKESVDRIVEIVQAKLDVLNKIPTP